MSKARAKGRKPALTFAAAIDAAEHLTLVPGLGALKQGEGKGQITALAAALIGSVAMDEDCRAAYPNDNRWDYVIGLRRSKTESAHFVEVHSAETSEVSTVEKKLDWLLRFLELAPQKALRALPREIHWVASGRVNIPQHVPQYRKLHTTLRARGLRGPVRHLPLV